MNSPLDRKSRICIVGAGPAGITTALEYKKLGYDHVVVFERRDRVGGRCISTPDGNDLGAIAWAPGAHDEFTRFTDELGIEREWVPPLTNFTAATGQKTPKVGLIEMCLTYLEAIRYLWVWRNWSGVAEPGFGKISEVLSAPWSEFTRKNKFLRFSNHVEVPLLGFGYRDLPAVYGVRYISPKPMLGAVKAKLKGGESLGNWQGGTAQIWEKLIERHNLDVKVGVTINAIERADTVKLFVENSSTPLEFDYLVLACNPKNLIDTLDTDEREAALFSQFRTFDYRAFECRVTGFAEGKTIYAAFSDNLDEAGFNRPAVVYKRFTDSDLMVVWVNANDATDETIIENMRDDFAAVGGVLIEVKSRHHFDDYCPHVGADAIRAHFFESLGELQGHRHTMGVGAAYTFDIIPHVMDQSRAMVRAHVAGNLNAEAYPSNVSNIERPFQNAAAKPGNPAVALQK